MHRIIFEYFSFLFIQPISVHLSFMATNLAVLQHFHVPSNSNLIQHDMVSFVFSFLLNFLYAHFFFFEKCTACFHSTICAKLNELFDFAFWIQNFVPIAFVTRASTITSKWSWTQQWATRSSLIVAVKSSRNSIPHILHSSSCHMRQISD